MPKVKSNTKSSKKSAPRKRYKNTLFLKLLGEHCRALRLKNNYSIDRLSKEAEQLSPASIDRLERGLADTQVLVLLRYADTLGVSIQELFTFTNKTHEILKEYPILPYEKNLKPPSGFVPVYTAILILKLFENMNDDIDPIPLGWIDVGAKSNSHELFVTINLSESMHPIIPKGSLVLFKKYSGGPRQGRIFLIQAHGIQNTEAEVPFIIRRYSQATLKDPLQNEVKLVTWLTPENPQFDPLFFKIPSESTVQTLAEFVRVL